MLRKPAVEQNGAYMEHLSAYIAASPTAYHAVSHTATLLDTAGYTALSESEPWSLTPGAGYYVTRNGSSLITFRAPTDPQFSGFMMAAAHGDSPAFKIKENATLTDAHYTRLSVEKYGGMLCSTWLDRPLSVAGRVTIRTEGGLATRLVDLGGTQAVIPNVAIHMNRSANDSMSYNPATDMLPLIGDAADADTLRARVAKAAGVAPEDILTTDLFLYNPQSAVTWSGFISAPRLDDLQCAYAALSAFLAAKESAGAVPVLCLFDNEEVGSQTKQGAASTFLFDVLTRLTSAVGATVPLSQLLSASLLVSADNAHAVHPNHPEYADRNHSVYMNAGIVIKHNANQRYTTDAISSGLFTLLCERAGVPVQHYANRADMPGGSTLGNIANTQVSLNTVDIGLAQLAMHSAYETAGEQDTASLISALTELYSSALKPDGAGGYTIMRG